MGDHGQTFLQTFIGLTAQLCDLVIGKFRQDRRAFIRLERTAFGDFDGVFDRLGQIGEQRDHFLGGFEIVLRRQTAARFVLVNIGAFGDTDQRVVGFVNVGFVEIDIVGRDQRNIHAIGHFNEPAFGQAFGLWRAVFAWVTLKFDIQTIGKDRFERLHQFFGFAALAHAQQTPHGAIRAARQTNQAFVMAAQIIQFDLRQPPTRVHIQNAVQLHQVFIPAFVLGQQNDWRGVFGAFTRFGGDETHIHLTADNRLNASARHIFGKFQRTEHVVRVCHRNGGHVQVFDHTGQFFHLHRPL